MRRCALILFLIFVGCFLANANNNFSEYVDVIKNFYKEKQNDLEIIQNWRDGVKEDYGYDVDHISIEFEFIEGAKTTDGKIVIIGIITCTAYCCTQDNQKLRIIQMSIVAFLITKNKNIEKVLKLKDAPQHILKPGWDDKFDELNV
jgi:hypothetical protein